MEVLLEPPHRSRNSTNTLGHDWRQNYQSLLQETHTEALFRHVEIAEASIRTRRESLMESSNHHVERKELDEALAHIRFLKKSRLGLTDLEEFDD
jgi:hypothetical protein